MQSEVFIAIIGFLGTVFGSVLGIFANSKMLNYRIKQLEDRVKLHNNVVERMTVAEKDIKNIYHQIDEFKK